MLFEVDGVDPFVPLEVDFLLLLHAVTNNAKAAIAIRLFTFFIIKD